MPKDVVEADNAVEVEDLVNVRIRQLQERLRKMENSLEHPDQLSQTVAAAYKLGCDKVRDKLQQLTVGRSPAS